jgi:uncharacterized protein (TIGR02996 family)
LFTTAENLVNAIHESPRDPAPRLVYADWLEEQGDEVSRLQAEYLRVECELDASPADSLRRPRLRKQLQALRRRVGKEWWRALDWAPVERCISFLYRCPKRWDTLAPTANPAVRHCDACKEEVYYCSDVSEAEAHAEQGRCVAIDSREPRLRGEMNRTGQFFHRIGRVAPSVPRRVPLPLRGPR